MSMPMGKAVYAAYRNQVNARAPSNKPPIPNTRTARNRTAVYGLIGKADLVRENFANIEPSDLELAKQKTGLISSLVGLFTSLDMLLINAGLPADFLIVRVVSTFAGLVQGHSWATGAALSTVAATLRMFPYWTYYVQFLSSLGIFPRVSNADTVLRYFAIENRELDNIVRYLFVDNRLKVIKLLSRSANSIVPGELGILQLVPQVIGMHNARTLYRVLLLVRRMVGEKLDASFPDIKTIKVTEELPDLNLESNFWFQKAAPKKNNSRNINKVGIFGPPNYTKNSRNIKQVGVFGPPNYTKSNRKAFAYNNFPNALPKTA